MSSKITRNIEAWIDHLRYSSLSETGLLSSLCNLLAMFNLTAETPTDKMSEKVKKVQHQPEYSEPSSLQNMQSVVRSIASKINHMILEVSKAVLVLLQLI